MRELVSNWHDVQKFVTRICISCDVSSAVEPWTKVEDTEDSVDFDPEGGRMHVSQQFSLHKMEPIWLYHITVVTPKKENPPFLKRILPLSETKQ